MALSLKSYVQMFVCFGLFFWCVDGRMSFEPSPPESDPEDSRTINTNFDKTFGWKTWFIIIGVSLTFFALFYGYKLFYVCKLYLNERDLYYTKMENV